MTTVHPTDPILRHWSHGILSCFHDRNTCLLSCFCPQVLFGKMAARLDRPFLPYMMLAMTPCVNLYCCVEVRQEIRDRRRIPGSVWGDLLCYLTCSTCALIQQSLELDLEELEEERRLKHEEQTKEPEEQVISRGVERKSQKSKTKKTITTTAKRSRSEPDLTKQEVIYPYQDPEVRRTAAMYALESGCLGPGAIPVMMVAKRVQKKKAQKSQIYAGDDVDSSSCSSESSSEDEGYSGVPARMPGTDMIPPPPGYMYVHPGGQHVIPHPQMNPGVQGHLVSNGHPAASGMPAAHQMTPVVSNQGITYVPVMVAPQQGSTANNNTAALDNNVTATDEPDGAASKPVSQDAVGQGHAIASQPISNAVTQNQPTASGVPIVAPSTSALPNPGQYYYYLPQNFPGGQAHIPMAITGVPTMGHHSSGQPLYMVPCPAESESPKKKKGHKRSKSTGVSLP